MGNFSFLSWAVSFWFRHSKNFKNRPTFAKVTVKIKVAQFFWLTVYNLRTSNIKKLLCVGLLLSHNAGVLSCARLNNVSNGLLDVLGLHHCKCIYCFLVLCSSCLSLSVCLSLGEYRQWLYVHVYGPCCLIQLNECLDTTQPKNLLFAYAKGPFNNCHTFSVLFGPSVTKWHNFDYPLQMKIMSHQLNHHRPN